MSLYCKDILKIAAFLTTVNQWVVTSDPTSNIFLIFIKLVITNAMNDLFSTYAIHFNNLQGATYV